MFRIIRTKTKQLALLLCAAILLISSTTRSNQNFAHLFDKIFLGIDINEIESNWPQIIRSSMALPIAKKPWTIILYVAADNDLRPFAIRNIRQMAKVGSNRHFNIVVQLDIKKENGVKTTRRYYIKEGEIIHLNANDPTSQKMDSGDPETLISCCKWAITNFPADNFGLVLWNHGLGALDPVRARIIRTEELFNLNYNTQKLELDRTIGYLDRMISRGICWDDSTGNYLSNQKMDYALKTICTKYLKGKKFLFLGFDACLMQMIEVANIAKNYAHVMIGSQEAELGYGWNYADMLAPFNRRNLTPDEFVDHIIASYERSYEKITNDYTLSAINLDDMHHLEKNVNDIASLLMKGLIGQQNGMMKKMIKVSRNKNVCTHFDEPSYIDLHHFYGNLLANINYIKMHNKQDEKQMKEQLRKLLQDGRQLIEDITIYHTEGESLSLAQGISIYFPENRVYPSYKKIPFAQDNNWIRFLACYLAT